MPDAYIRDLSSAGALADADLMIVDQGADGLKVALSALRTFFATVSQPLDSDLTAIAALTTTSTGRALLTAANAAAIATAAGVGTGDSPTFTALTLSGGQIAFPASQNASADPNTLDDYEEGTFTPIFTAATPPTGVTYGTNGQLGSYTKIGNRVAFGWRILLSSKGTGGSGAISLQGLPFTVANTAAGIYNAVATLVNVTFAAGVPTMNLVQNSVSMGLAANVSGAAVTSVAWADCVDTSSFRASGNYHV